MGKLIDNNALSRDKAMAFDKFLKLEKIKQQQAELAKQQQQWHGRSR